MANEETDDFDVVVMNPAAFYKGPDEVMADAELTHDQKLRLLEEWELDLKRTLESDGEGMAQMATTGTRDNHDADSALLRNVTNWRRRATEEGDLKDYPSAPKTKLGRVWRRLFGPSSKSKQAA